MRTKNINIRSSFCNILVKKGMLDTLYSYSVSAYLMAGLGYYDKKDFMGVYCKFTGLNKRTFYRHINDMKSLGMIRENGKTLYIKGKKDLYTDFDAKVKTSISFQEDALKDKKEYKKVLVQQSALIVQAKYRYIFKSLKEKAEGLYSEGGINNIHTLPQYKEDVGASLSMVSEYTGFCKSDVQKHLIGVTKKVFKRGRDITDEELKQMKDSGYFKRNYKESYGISKKSKRPYIKHSLSSVITCKSLIKKVKW